MTTAEDQASQASLAQGGIPVRAQRRLAELGGAPGGLFTSTLSPAETLIAKNAGLEPVSQVMGSAFYHVGFAGYVSTWTGGELAVLTQAHERARLLALSRLEQEATLLRAHAVIDTSFVSRGYHWATDLIEYTAIGTAVRIKGEPLPQRPALTLLRADEYVKLHQAGYAPLGIAMGNCFWYDPHADCSRDGSFWSSELPKHTLASQITRDYAVTRFRAAAANFPGVHGVLGVQVVRKLHSHEEDGHCVMHAEMMVIGTAVAKKTSPPPKPRPLLVVDLRDRGMTRGYQP